MRDTNGIFGFKIFVAMVCFSINAQNAPNDIDFADKAYKFNGTNSYIEVPYAAENHPSIFTIEFWARLDQDTGDFQSPLSSRYGASPWNNLSGYNFYAVNGLEKWSFTAGSGTWESINTSSSTIGEIYDGNTLKFGIWTHLASTYDGTTYRFYVNGVLAGSKTAGYSRVGFNSIPARPLRIGAGRTEGTATYFFNGAVDEVRIWNYVRTESQISNYKNVVLSGQESGLVSYYNFDNGNASNETGESARDGTLYNSPTIITRNPPGVNEGAVVGTFVGNLTATDPDSTNFTFSLVSGNGTNDQHNSLFTVSGTQLLVASSTISYDTSTSLNVNIGVSDGQNTFNKAFQIAVNDLNRAPTDIGLTSNTVTENVSPYTVIGTLSSVDLDTTDTSSFTFTTSGNTDDDDNGSFTISGTSLILNSSPDYETKASYNIYINVNDGANNYAKAFTVSVTNINEAPMDLEFAPNQITQNGLLIYVDANNPNSRGTNQWTDLSGNGNHATVTGGALGNNNYYTLDGNDHFKWSTDVLSAGSSFTMQVRLKTTNNNWHGSMPLYNTFGPSDSGFWHHFQADGTLGSTLGTMGSANSNDGVGIVQDQWQLTTLTYDGSAMKLYKNGTLQFTKQGSVSWNLANSGASAGKLNYRSSGAQYFFHGLISSQLIYNRALTQTEIEGNYGILNGTASTSTSTTSFDEGSAVGTLVATLTATDSDTTNLTYSLVTGNGTNDQHNSLFTVSGTQLLVASSTISYDDSTYLKINLGVSDGDTTISKAFQIAVNDLNRAPTDISLTSNTVTENISPSTVVGTLSSVDLDTTDTTSFTLATSGNTDDDDNGSFTISGTSLILNSSPDYETKASYNIYINVNDGANNYAKAFTVSVTNVLEPITDLSFAGADFVTDGLILHLDAANSNSYPGSGSTWFDLSGNNNHATINGPTFSNSQIKHFLLDGSNDDIASMNLSSYTNLTIEVWYYDNRTPGQYDLLTYNGNSGSYTFTNNNFRTDGNGMGAANFNGASQISNQWVRFVYVKNSKVFINDTPTNKSSGSDNAYGQLKIGDARSDVGQHWDGKIALVRVYNRALTDQEISKNYDGFNAVINNSQTLSDSSTSTSVDEEVSIGTQVGTLTATDSDTTSFTFSLVSGNGTNDQHNALFTVSGTQLLVAGNIDYETNSTLNIYVQASDGTNTFSKSLTVNVNDINEPPVITETTLSNDNSSISVTFSEAVNASADVSNTLALEVSDFALSINGGTATLSSATPSSISVNGNTFTLGLPVSGSISGSETVTVVPIINAIYDAGAATASTTQTNNTVSLHGDSDSDGVNDALDQCPNTPGGASVDVNGCAESQKDPDNDGITGINDNCPNTANSNQMDTDGDGLGDLCDPDIDGDGIVNASDNCPSDYNPDQKNNDNDNQGDLCDLDDDNDGYNDLKDFFPFDPLEWLDTDRDGIGNNADTDDDNDDFIDTDDAFPLNPREWADNDKDGIGDNKDPDDDNDGVEDKRDAFPMDDSEYLDTDKDGIGNNADEDDDGDGYKDQDEIACDSDPLKRFSKPRDYDGDLIPDCIDTDDDDDGCLDEQDLFPLNERECEDSDGDGIGDNSDIDADNDGVINQLDDFPTDPDESKDTDGDGIGDNADLDDNNDGFPEDTVINSAGEEVIPIFVSELLTPNQTGEESKWRIVNIDKYPTANVKVYSPSGIIVYESWEYNNDWSGKDKKGRPLPNGPYLYIIDRGDETLIEEGWLYIFN
jgi:gliding motility-associated-like protein